MSAIDPHAAYGLLAHILIFGAFAALLPFGEWRPRLALAASAFAAMVGIAPTLLGLTGAPSLTLLQLAVLSLAGRPLAPPPRAAALLALASLLVLLGPADVFALGYPPAPLLAALAPVAAALWWRGMTWALLILAVDIAGYAAGLFDNLWQALVDPLFAGLMAILALRGAVLWFSATRLR